MRSFTDNEGHVWTIAITLGKVRKIRELIGLDLLNPHHYLQVLGSLADQMAIAFLIVKPQADALRLDEDGFESRLYGEGITHSATIALLEETALFFQKLDLPKLVGLAKVSMEVMSTEKQKLDQMIASGTMEQMIAEIKSKMQTMFH